MAGKKHYKYAILSDVHSNLEALKAVLSDIEKRGINRVIFLGDAVGYGPDPNEVVSILKKRCLFLLAGNHDWAVIDYTPVDYFNEAARTAIQWTKEHITVETFETLKGFQISKSIKQDSLFCVHSTPKEPDSWNYLLSLEDAEINFHYFEEQFCFLGHSHRPFIIERLPTGELLTYKDRAEINSTSRYIVNAGSVGQPRDGDPRAAYALFSEDTLEIVRVEYDIKTTQEKMLSEGLPEMLIERLSRGL